MKEDVINKDQGFTWPKTLRKVQLLELFSRRTNRCALAPMSFVPAVSPQMVVLHPTSSSGKKLKKQSSLLFLHTFYS